MLQRRLATYLLILTSLGYVIFPVMMGNQIIEHRNNAWVSPQLHGLDGIDANYKVRQSQLSIGKVLPFDAEKQPALPYLFFGQLLGLIAVHILAHRKNARIVRLTRLFAIACVFILQMPLFWITAEVMSFYNSSTLLSIPFILQAAAVAGIFLLIFDSRSNATETESPEGSSAAFMTKHTTRILFGMVFAYFVIFTLWTFWEDTSGTFWSYLWEHRTTEAHYPYRDASVHSINVWNSAPFRLWPDSGIKIGGLGRISLGFLLSMLVAAGLGLLPKFRGNVWSRVTVFLSFSWFALLGSIHLGVLLRIFNWSPFMTEASLKRYIDGTAYEKTNPHNLFPTVLLWMLPLLGLGFITWTQRHDSEILKPKQRISVLRRIRELLAKSLGRVPAKIWMFAGIAVVVVSLGISLIFFLPPDTFSRGTNEKKVTTGVIQETVVLRSQPSATAARAICRESSGETFSTLPSGNIVSIIERGATPVQVGKWNNYWYRVDVLGRKCTGEVWVFGEFLKIY